MYFDSRSLTQGAEMSDFYRGDRVEIDRIIERKPGKKAAMGMCILDEDTEMSGSELLSTQALY